jgi:DNA-binding IclR family transcriptional regulator
VTYPAWFDFHRDRVMVRNPACGAVYAAFVGLKNISMVPRPMKVWVLAEALGLKKSTVSRALDLLVGHGYLVEHERDEKNVRRFTVSIVIESGSSTPERTHPTAA